MIGLASILAAAPSIFDGVRGIYNAVTGDTAAETPDALCDQVAALPPDQQTAIINRATELQRMDTERFIAMTDGDAEKIRASARPQIALKAMRVISAFGFSLVALFAVAIVEWLVQMIAIGLSGSPLNFSIWDSLARIAPASEVIMVPALGAFWSCVEIIKKYMGCRERDKARADEIRAGRNLSSTAATIEAASGGIIGAIKAVRGR